MEAVVEVKYAMYTCLRVFATFFMMTYHMLK